VGPGPVRTTYYTDHRDALKALKAAMTLTLGVRVHNRWRPNGEDEPGDATEEWVIELFDDAPGLEER
jgi:hypothetical protein